MTRGATSSPARLEERRKRPVLGFETGWSELLEEATLEVEEAGLLEEEAALEAEEAGLLEEEAALEAEEAGFEDAGGGAIEGEAGSRLEL